MFPSMKINMKKNVHVKMCLNNLSMRIVPIIYPKRKNSVKKNNGIFECVLVRNLILPKIIPPKNNMIMLMTPLPLNVENRNPTTKMIEPIISNQ